MLELLTVPLQIAGTPYEGGYFRIRFAFGSEFPNLPPKCESSFVPWWPSVSRAGYAELCLLRH